MSEARLSQRMRDHVISRLPGAEPVVKNGAWQMMLDAVDELDRLEEVARRDREYCASQTSENAKLVNRVLQLQAALNRASGAA